MRSQLLLFLLPAAALGCAEILGYGNDSSSASGGGGSGAATTSGTGATGGTASSGATGGTAPSGGTSSGATGGTSTGATGGTAGTSGSAGSAPCSDGDEEPCYDGPPGTEGIGVCKGSTRTCVAGQWSMCGKQTLPSVERCSTANTDENCDQIASCTGQHRWGRRFGGGEVQGVETVASDAAGNFIVAGATAGPFAVGATMLPFAGGADMFLIKLAADGKPLWAKTFGSTGIENIEALRVDAKGNLLITGFFEGSFDLAGVKLTSAGGSDVFVAKLDPDGNALWAHPFGDAEKQQALALAVDAMGDVLVTGYYKSSMTFGAVQLPATTADPIDVNAFVAKLSGDKGDPLWAKGFGGIYDQTGTGIAATQQGDVWVTAGVAGPFDFGGPALPDGGSYDVAIGKLSGVDGAHLLSRRYGDVYAQGVTALTVLPDGGPVFAVYYTGDMTFDPQNPILGPKDVWDTAVVRLGPGGGFAWQTVMTGAAATEQVVTSLAVDADGKILASGYFGQSITFGPGQTNTFTASGATDAFLVKLALLDGAFVWGRPFQNSTVSWAFVAADPLGHIAFATSLFGQTDLGGGKLESTGLADGDVLVGRFAP